ncbi:MAG: HD domain-containing protein [Bdellovibrionales bacterium]|nr:HD domain-containing protein [Bdellovibrionales bacterium]
MEENNYFQIRVGTLVPDRPIPFDLYIHLHGKYIHYLRIGEMLTNEKISKLNTSDQFFVPSAQRPDFKKFIYSSMNEASLETSTKARILRDTSLALIEEIYEKKDINEALEDSKELMGQFVKLMESSPESVDHLIQLSSHDFYTFNHSLDVSVYSMGMGKLMGYNEADLTELGRGALFHDIGKKWVAAEIICKKGALDDAEWAQMKRHPEYGLKILSEYNVSEAIKACCFEHHESFLGNGYPQGLDGESIHPMARIVAIADTFDALTTQRSYNQPMSPKEAVLFLTTKIKDKYDPVILKALQAAVLPD